MDAFAEDDEHCAQIIRELIDYLPSNSEEEPPYLPTENPADRKCDSFNMPLVFLVDTPGFMGGKESEQKRLPTKIMRCQEAMAFVTVPKITLVVRKAYGLAAAIVCGPNSNPDFIAGLINADIRSMPPEAKNTCSGGPPASRRIIETLRPCSVSCNQPTGTGNRDGSA